MTIFYRSKDNKSSQPDFKAHLVIDILIKGVNIHKASHLHRSEERMGITFRVEFLLFVSKQLVSLTRSTLPFPACLVSLRMDSKLDHTGLPQHAGGFPCRWVDQKSVLPDHVSRPQNARAPWGCTSQEGPWDWHLSWCDHMPFLDAAGRVVSLCTVHSSTWQFQ